MRLSPIALPCIVGDNGIMRLPQENTRPALIAPMRAKVVSCVCVGSAGANRT